MDWNAVATELPKVIPVIVGGLLAIGGGIAGQILTHQFSARRERDKLIREKAELLISALYEHRDWLNRENSRLVFGADLQEQPSPLDRAYALQELYFPELSGALRDITSTLIPIAKFFYTNARARNTDKATWIAAFDSNEFTPLYEAYLNAFKSATEQIVIATRQRIKT